MTPGAQVALDPRILFLDEPSVGLDPITSAGGVDKLILELAQYFGMTFVIVTHDLASIDAIASRVIMVEENARTIIASGTPDELRGPNADPIVRRFFKREAEADSP